MTVVRWIPNSVASVAIVARRRGLCPGREWSTGRASAEVASWALVHDAGGATQQGLSQGRRRLEVVRGGGGGGSVLRRRGWRRGWWRGWWCAVRPSQSLGWPRVNHGRADHRLLTLRSGGGLSFQAPICRVPRNRERRRRGENGTAPPRRSLSPDPHPRTASRRRTG